MISNNLPRVVIIEDEVLVRDWLKDKGNLNNISIIIGDYESFDQGAEETIFNQNVDAVILDIRLGIKSLNGIEVAKKIKDKSPRIGVVLLSELEGRVREAESLLSHFEGLAYICKKSINKDPKILERYITSSIEGGISVDPGIAAEIENLINKGEGPVYELTSREIDVRRLVCMGYTNYAIAEKLSLKGKTVETYLTNIFSKMGIDEDLTDDNLTDEDLTDDNLTKVKVNKTKVNNQRVLLVRKWLSSL